MIRRRASERWRSAAERSDSSTPALSARISRARRKSTFSICSTKLKRSPPLSQPKQCQDCCCSLTLKLGVFSGWKGQRPQSSRPRLRSGTYCWTTSTRFRRDLIWSTVSSDLGRDIAVPKYAKEGRKCPPFGPLRRLRRHLPRRGEACLALLRGYAVEEAFSATTAWAAASLATGTRYGLQET